LVERLKAAVEKARAQREAAAAGAAGAGPAPGVAAAAVAAGSLWRTAPVFIPEPDHLRDSRIVCYDRSDPSFVSFDLLRTRLLAVCRENGWRRIGVTSPRKANGKSTLCLNLAMSLARYSDLKVALFDLDMKAPHIAGLLGAGHEPKPMADALAGRAPLEAVTVTINGNLAVLLNTDRERDSAETLGNAGAVAVLKGAFDALAPDLALFDLPPLFVTDDAIAFGPNLDAALLIIEAEETTAEDVLEAERMLTGATRFLGVVLNKCKVAPGEAYSYDYT
jgi:Mrp family chromosome partitioning ATPase